MYDRDIGTDTPGVSCLLVNPVTPDIGLALRGFRRATELRDWLLRELGHLL